MRNKCSKYNNPSKRRSPRPLSREEREIRATKEMLAYYEQTGSACPENLADEIKRKWRLDG